MRLSWPTLHIDRLRWLLGQHSSLHIVMVRELYVQSSDETWMTDLLIVPEAAIQDTKDRIASEVKADEHRREHSIENIVACELADDTQESNSVRSHSGGDDCLDTDCSLAGLIGSAVEIGGASGSCACAPRGTGCADWAVRHCGEAAVR